MSWVKIDDAAPEHEKLLDAGAQAAWLWVCCLAYCNRQKRRDGLIPKAKIALLYPGLGLKHARRLVEVGLLHDADRCFAMHDYHEYQPSEDLSLARSMAGKQGGIKSGASRRSKSEANAKQRLEPRPDPVPARPDQQDTVAADSEPAESPLTDRAKSWLEQADAGDGKGRGFADLNFGPPSKWPETLSVLNVFASIYQRRDDPRHSGDPRCRVIVERFAEGYSPEDLFDAIGGSTHDRNISENRQFQTIKTILRDAAQVDKFRALVAPPAAAQSAEETERMAKALEADNARREAEGRVALASFTGGRQ